MSDPERFAIVTPYYKESRDVLERCIDSVKRQTVAADHFLISDGFPQDWVDGAGVRHIRLGRAHGDCGNAARGIGAMLAVCEGYGGIGLLDADNWYNPDHVEQCRAAAVAPADLVIAKRRILLPDGTPINLQEEPGHVDTSCFWFLPGSYHLIHHWSGIPLQFAQLCDRVFYWMIQAHPLVVAHTRMVTVNYTANYPFAYRAIGIKPPPDIKTIDIRPMLQWVRGLDQRQQQVLKRRCGVDLYGALTDPGSAEYRHLVRLFPRILAGSSSENASAE